MAAAVVSGLLFALLCTVAARAPLKWPDKYSTEGNIILPYADINEPFKAVVDMSKGSSYMNTYNGTATVINRKDVGDYGTVFKIVPETTQDFANRMTCFKVPGDKDAEVAAQGILPDLSNYDYVTDYTYKDTKCSLYISSYSEGSKNNNYTLLVNKDNGYPVFFRFIGFDRLIGSHYDEYIIEYSKFEETVNSSVFEVTEDKCISFPGPGNALAMAENPMFEYFGASGFNSGHQAHRIDKNFELFKDKYGKDYRSREEEERRKIHFRYNHRYIESMNRRNLTFKLEVNHMADHSDVERKRMRGYRHTKNSPKGELFMSKADDVPTYMNWWLSGAVTPVKDQGICGSCWSFGTTGTIEGSYFIKKGKLVPMSEQALVDCSWGYGNNGCDGGESERAYQWIIENGCIPSEESYNGGIYLMQDGYCRVNESECGAKLSKFYNTPSGDTSALMSAIYEKGPISVAIDASHRSFSFYSHGVYYEPECGNGEDDLDHQVLAVGYGVNDDQEYWIVKNSWSTHWGMDGYVLMSRKDNNCGVATDASYADIM